MEDWVLEEQEQRHHDAKMERLAKEKKVRDDLLNALEEMVAWFVDPGRGLYDQKPEIYLAGSKPIVAKARAAILQAKQT